MSTPENEPEFIGLGAGATAEVLDSLSLVIVTRKDWEAIVQEGHLTMVRMTEAKHGVYSIPGIEPYIAVCPDLSYGFYLARVLRFLGQGVAVVGSNEVDGCGVALEHLDNLMGFND